MLEKEVACIIMAGGLGSRLKITGVEKPLLTLLGKPMVKYIIDAAVNSRYIKEIFVAVSPNTPKTTEYIHKLNIKMIKTPGRGYVEDLTHAIYNVFYPNILICPVDTPLIKSKDIDNIIDIYFKLKKPSVVVVAPIFLLKRIGIKPKYKMSVDGLLVAPCGISVISRKEAVKNNILEESYYITKNIRFAINVNTKEDLKLAIKILRRLDFT